MTNKIFGLNDIKVYTLLFSLCYKGKRSKCYREIKINNLAKALKLTYKQTRTSLDRLLANQLFNKTTAVYFDKQSHSLKRSSFYRINPDF